MNKIIFWTPVLLLGLNISLLGQVQHGKIDSLLGALAEHRPDTHKMYCALTLAKQYVRISDYQKADQYLEVARSLAERYAHTMGLALYYQQSGLVQYYQSNYEPALEKIKMSLQLAIELNHQRGMADCYNNLGMIYNDQGYYGNAIEQFKAALQLRRPEEKRDRSAHYMNLGNAYYRLGDMPLALENYLQSLELDTEIGDKYDLALTNTNLGNFYADQKQWDLALHHHLMAVQYCREAGNTQCIGFTSTNLAAFYGTQDKVEEALVLYLEALKVFEQNGNKRDMVTCYNQIGFAYRRLSEFDSAKVYYEKALPLARELGNQSVLGDTYFGLGRLYLDRKEFPAARARFNEALQVFSGIRAKPNIRNSYRFLSMVDTMSGNYKDALRNYQLYMSYRDSILNERNTAAIAEIEKKYDSARKDKEIFQLESERTIRDLQFRIQQESLFKTRSQNLLQHQQITELNHEKQLSQLESEKHLAEATAQQTLAKQKEDEVKLLEQDRALQAIRLERQKEINQLMFGGVAIILLVGFLGYRYYDTRQQLKLQKIRNKIASDLHDDVGSTLSSIAIFSEMAQLQSKETLPLLNTIHESSRKMLDAMGDIVWTINPENDQFEKIIMRMRNFAYELLGVKQIEFEFNADEEVADIRLPMEVRKNIYLIFKEATNNMVKYSEASKASFSLEKKDNQLMMHIRDNGKGFNPDITPLGNGVKSMQNRAAEIGAKLAIESEEGQGTSILMRVAV